jgi:hypothetical protein
MFSVRTTRLYTHVSFVFSTNVTYVITLVDAEISFLLGKGQLKQYGGSFFRIFVCYLRSPFALPLRTFMWLEVRDL